MPWTVLQRNLIPGSPQDNQDRKGATAPFLKLTIMEEGELIKEFLGDMPVARFIAMYVFAFMGMILFFGADVAKAIKYDKRTANFFSWRDLFRYGGFRLLASIIFVAVGVLFYGELSMQLMNSEVPLVIDGLAAFMMGTRADMYVNKILGLRKNGK
jgi:hypothetical protein